MNPDDLGKLIMQNIKVMDAEDALFELKQLEAITKNTYDDVSKILAIPNVDGRPEMLKKAMTLFAKDFPDYKKSKLTNDNIDRYEPQGRQ